MAKEQESSKSRTTEKATYRALEAAGYLSVSRSTIWRYAKQGLLTPVKLSDRVTIFTKEDLDNLIAGA